MIFSPLNKGATGWVIIYLGKSIKHPVMQMLFWKVVEKPFKILKSKVVLDDLTISYPV